MTSNETKKQNLTIERKYDG